MKLLQITFAFLMTALCGNAIAFAAPASKDITLKEALETNAFAPETRDEIPCAKDKIIGKWTWEKAEKIGTIEDYPTPKRPWKDVAKIKKLIEDIDGLLNGDPKKTKAFPAAEDFPGVPEGEVDIIERQVIIDPAIGGWHSLGLYALPGAKITVSVNGKMKTDVSLRIGCHTDFITWGHLEKHHNSTLKRLPKMCTNTRIKAGEKKAELANPMGGLIYIDVHSIDPKSKPVKFTISGGIASPLFILGPKDSKGIDIAVTTQEEWQRQLATYKAPWGEIQVPRLTFTVPLEHLKILKIPRRLCKNIQRGMAAQDWLIAWDKFPEQINRPMRFVIDQQISVGYGHSGYPAMGYMDWGNCIKTGKLVKEGSWGLWHEIGHNHQWSPFAFEGCTEVTVNMFSAISQTQAIGVPYSRAWDGGSIEPEKMKSSVQEFFKSGRTFDEEEDCGVKLYFFLELMRGVGYDSFRKVALQCHKESPFKGGATNQEKWDFFLITLSEVTQKNLAPYFDRWKINVSAKAKSKVKKYKPWSPCPGYPKNFPAYEAERKAAAEEAEAELKELIEKKKKADAERKAAERRERAKKILENT